MTGANVEGKRVIVTELKSETKNMNKGVEQITTRMQRLKQGINNVVSSVGRFRMEFLGVMFFGMAMQRMFAGIITSAFQSFKAITEGTSMANNAVTSLLASWEFFKFSLFQALLATPMFQQIVAFLTRMAEGFANLSPKIQGLIAKTIIWGAIVGTLLFLWGTLALGVGSLTLALGNQLLLLINIATWVGKITGLSKVLLAIWTAMGGLKPLVAALKLAAVIGVLLVIIKIFNMLREKFGNWQGALASWASAFALALALVVQGIVDIAQSAFNVLFRLLASLVNMLARVARFVGFNKMAAELTKGADEIRAAANATRVDVVGKTAEFLDKSSFLGQSLNPQPVAITQNNEYNIDGSAGSTKDEDLLAEIERVQMEAAERIGQGVYTTN